MGGSHRSVLSQSSEAGSPDPGASRVVSPEASLLGLQTAALLCSPMVVLIGTHIPAVPSSSYQDTSGTG